ncbi:Fur family transcriptional regulator [Christiangramia forsetii]|uniref:Fur family transcriptional regulator protein n=2 Tax=Christiangramia forsetii TaxID=411153 RepID=A0LY09_CHRFK|nr:transcriptional repressor [Christiangramia forsetii]GGG35291.1 transcriptional regulator [Christiangramia forsetii]CAL65254.1 Fur family transcriptional regulator protein [Christiangramia forsetii KT0803]
MNEIEKVLQEHQVRPTAIRLLMYKFLRDRQVAVTLNDIESDFEMSERTTLYRTIKTFEKNGLVHQIDDGTGVAKYALDEPEIGSGSQDLHLHFHCTNCNETLCLTDHKIPHISLPKGFVTQDMNLVLKGICDRCNEN